MAKLRKPETYRKALVETIRRENPGVLTPDMEAAFLSIPRHEFLPEDIPLDRAYTDEAIPIKRDADGTVLSSSSQPSMMALMLKQLDLRPGDNVLEIGAGTGYNAAIMQYIVGEEGNITSVELDKQIALQASLNLQRARLGAVVSIVNADGAQGYAPRASYDRIIATVGIWDVPDNWVRQLKPDGVLVAPIWLESMQVSAALTVQPDGTLYSSNNLSCGFVPLRGIAAGPNVYRRVSGSGLVLASNDIRQIDSAAMHSLLSEDSEIALLSLSLSPSEFWQGFIPYLTLNVPSDFRFALYTVGENQQSYGITGTGFALIARGSACFVPYGGSGEARSFAGSDAFLALSDLMLEWDHIGRPGVNRLHLKLVPHDEESITPPPNYRVYSRLYHDLHVWMDI